MTQMLLKSLHIHEDYAVLGRKNGGRLIGTVEFRSGLGEVKISIDADKASRIIAIVAEEMVAESKRVAEMMTAQIIDQAEGRLIEG